MINNWEMTAIDWIIETAAGRLLVIHYEDLQSNPLQQIVRCLRYENNFNSYLNILII